MSRKRPTHTIKFLGRLPDVTKHYRNNHIETFKRFVVYYISNTKFKHVKMKVGFIFNRRGDEYVIFDLELLSWGWGNKYFTVDTDGEIDDAPEYVLKSFDEHLKLFPKKNKP